MLSARVLREEGWWRLRTAATQAGSPVLGKAAQRHLFISQLVSLKYRQGVSFVCVCVCVCVCVVFLGLHLRHMEVSRLQTELEL